MCGHLIYYLLRLSLLLVPRTILQELSSPSNRLLELLSCFSQWFQTPCLGLQTESTSLEFWPKVEIYRSLTIRAAMLYLSMNTLRLMINYSYL